MTLDDKQSLARRFLSVLGHPDAEVVKSVAIDDVVWSFPGDSRISGEAHGVEGIMERARMSSRHTASRLKSSSRCSASAAWRCCSTILARRSGRVLDEQRGAAVFTFRGDKIARLDTYLSDVAMMENFFDA